MDKDVFIIWEIPPGFPDNKNKMRSYAYGTKAALPEI